MLKGEKLVSKGQVVTAEQVEALQALRLQSDSRILTPHIGLFILVILCYLILYFYLKFYEKTIFNRKPAILLLGVVMVVILLICKLISLISFNMDAELTAQIGYLLPVTAASMVLTVLLDREVAAMCTVVLAVFIGIMMDGSMAFPLMALAGGLTGIITASRLNQRSQFVGASAYITLANLLVVGAWGLIWHQSYSAIGIGMLFGLINGLLSAILAMGILPYLESAFGITTVIRLLELSNSNHPLLKRLMMEAPGTYNHSILVGNLAEAAADAIGANTLLVRVASYYHDIGKLKRPHFYIENQRPGENPHDKLQPGLSAMIITSHTTDGSKMLREEHFPEEIIDIVEQHHGNSVLKYFYNKAKEQALDPDEVKVADYRYKGRRPQTKEAALVMLADSVQAAAQAINSQDGEQVKDKVFKVINAKMQEGQLADCPLTFKDLEVISQSFLMVLSGMNHQRINYPDNATEALIGEAANDNKTDNN
ncbi:MAG: HDIG domain-containing protein [Firmicutes bacterium]|nr:HDIG domain-containing protein [Bacillota bacterium]